MGLSRAAAQRIKYGVIAAEALRADLHNWDTCYVSGRLHKPVQILQADEPLLRAHESNLQSALAAGILLLPPRFTLQVRSIGWTQRAAQQQLLRSGAAPSLSLCLSDASSASSALPA